MSASDNVVTPLQPGETTQLIKPRAGHCILVVYPSGREIDCGTSDYALGLEFEERLKAGIPIRDPRLLTIDAILSETYPGLEKMRIDETLMPRLQAFFSGYRVIDISPLLCEAYIDDLDDLFASGSIRNDVKKLQQYVGAALAHYRCSWRPMFELPPTCLARTRWLTRGEVARLLLACRGWQWEHNPAKRRLDSEGRVIPWKVDEAGRPILRSKEEREARKYMARLVILGVYTASRSSKLFAATWSRSDTHAYVDQQLGLFARRGDRERGPANKLAPHVPLLPNVRRLMFGLEDRKPEWRPGKGGWHGEDLSRGFDHVLHEPNGSPVTYPWGLWPAVRHDAGLGEDVLIHTLRHTAATWLLEAGLSEIEVAEFLGITPEILARNYAQVDPRFTEVVATAVDRGISPIPKEVLRAVRRAPGAAPRRRRKLHR